MSEPVSFLPEPKPCARCKLPTITRKVGKRMSQALHITCDPRPVPDLDLPDLVDVLADISNVLGPLSLDPPPSSTQPDQVGPCVRCRRPCRRYGTEARALCHRCDERTPPMIVNVPLFEFYRCDCGHTVPAIGEANDPCPSCLEDRDVSHDCPLREMSPADRPRNGRRK